MVKNLNMKPKRGDLLLKTIEDIRKTLDQNKERFKEIYKANEISIFGSYAKSTQNEESDLDVLVEFKEPVSLLHIVSFENHLSDIVGIKVDVVPIKNIRSELKEEILKDAILL